MSEPWLPALTAKVLAVLDRKRLPGTIAIAFLAVAGLTISLVSIFGDANDGEPKQIVKIARAEATASGEGGPIVDAPAGIAATALAGAVSLVGDQALMETTSLGPLPRIAADGRKPMNVYGRAYDSRDKRPKVAIVVGGLGVGQAITDAALERLPAEVTLAFTPYGQTLAANVATARARGHEVLIETPMEPEPGPYTLSRGGAVKNTLRLKWMMSRVAGYAGLINTHGAPLLSNHPDAAFVLGETARRGLFFVENNDDPRSVARQAAVSAGAPYAKADGLIGRTPTREAIEKECASLEGYAKAHGAALVVTDALPVTIDRVTAWAKALGAKGLALVPASAIVGATPVAMAQLPAAPASAKPRSETKPQTRATTQAVGTPKTQDKKKSRAEVRKRPAHVETVKETKPARRRKTTSTRAAEPAPVEPATTSGESGPAPHP